MSSAVQVFFWRNADASILEDYSFVNIVTVQGLFEAIIVENIIDSEFYLRLIIGFS